ncbi:hypothetical protein J2847_002986 [Azospirillum agricola]|uniref:hypothetical protein n=1 Tax=Azospirillum agricola TaxID=1720247 RepID=UPI001AE33DFD|nr:hypothetical protein [Azospirillum agricola]MBP2229687.1 hypothetical protein [Azospirillum agricola]
MRTRSVPEIRLSELHFRRHAVELRPIQGLLDRYRQADEARHHSVLSSDRYYQSIQKPIEDRIQAAFPDGSTERQVWEVIRREEHFEYLLSKWQRDGRALFAFSRPLLEMLGRTDVMALPVKTLRMPYDTSYVALPPGTFLPDFHPRFEIDGFYIECEVDLATSMRRPPTPDDEIVADTRKLWADPRMVEWLRSYGLDPYPDYETHLAGRLAENAEAWSEYHRFMGDPDTVLDEAADKGLDPAQKGWSPFWSIIVDFTFKPRGRGPAPLSTAELLDMPWLRFALSFPSHRNTVSEAIEYERRHGLPIDTYYEEDSYGEDDLRHVISRPEHIDDVVRLVFNVMCYLNWPDRDQERRLNDAHAHARVARASTRKGRAAAEAHALKDGARWIEFCGYRAERSAQPGAGGALPAHWRRGHWRHHRHGKGLTETKLLWIRPTMVGGVVGAAVPTVYQTAVSVGDG